MGQRPKVHSVKNKGIFSARVGSCLAGLGGWYEMMAVWPGSVDIEMLQELSFHSGLLRKRNEGDGFHT